MSHLRRLGPYLRAHARSLSLGLAYLIAAAALAAASPWVLRYAIDDLGENLTQGKLWLYAGALVSIVALEGVARFGTRMTLIGVSREIEYELRNDLFAHLSHLSPGYYHTHRIGELMSRATNDLSAVRMVLGPGIMYSANTAATLVATVSLMAALEVRLLPVALAPLVVVAWMVRHLGRMIHDRSEAVQQQLAELSAIVQENLAGSRVVRAYVQEQHERQRFAAANDEYLARSRRLVLIAGGLHPLIVTLLGIGAIAVLWQGGAMVARGALSLGEFVAFTVYLGMLQWPTIAVGWVANILERGEASMGRLLAILDAPVDISDDEVPSEDASWRPQGAVELRGLTLRLGQRDILRDVDLVVPAGTSCAIVGPTGSGKSVLVGLIPRLLDAPRGTVWLDGREIRSIPLRSLRSAVGFVPQETYLFSETISSNVALALGDADSPPPLERVGWASSVAQLEKDVADFPEGYETRVGERGVTLSGGQRQRTALARALVRDPRILILDDALSAVDAQTEDKILMGLREVMRSRTTFIVSHRISTVRDADQIVVLRDGRIVERGTHVDLVAQNGFYADLHSRQLIEDQIETE